MPITIDIDEHCTASAPYIPAPYAYVDTRPEDWWKQSDKIQYIEHSPTKDEDSQSQLEKDFWRLANTWKAQVRGSSSAASMVMNPAYLEIISYGDKVIPFILQDLKNEPNHWFIALRILAKTSPVKPEDAGNIKKMTESWLAWGKENGKLT